MWSGFDRFSLKHDASSQQETTLGDAEHISTIAGSLASIGTGHTETPVKSSSPSIWFSFTLWTVPFMASFVPSFFPVHRRTRVRHRSHRFEFRFRRSRIATRTLERCECFSCSQNLKRINFISVSFAEMASTVRSIRSRGFRRNSRRWFFSSFEVNRTTITSAFE